MEQYQPPKEVKEDLDLPENIRSYINKERAKMFILAALAGMTFMYILLLFSSHQIQQQKLYTEEYLYTCNIYRVCNYTTPIFCPSISCDPTYGCWQEPHNCTKILK